MASSKAEELWRDLLEKDDRTSPEEYPDMALITFDEFAHIFNAGWQAAVETLQTATFAPLPKPTIEELEKLLDEPNVAVRINPDGSITASPTPFENAAEYLATHRP